MEEIFNKIIEIDKKAKQIVATEKDKKQNIEEHIESEFNTKKVILDMEFKEQIQLQKRKYEEMFQERKQEIDEKLKTEMKETESTYKEKEDEIIKSIISSIKNEED